MNEYKYGRFIQDYVFLEELGRKVSEWGRDIQNKHLVDNHSLLMASGSGVNASGRRQQQQPGMLGVQRGNGRYSARGSKHTRTKREILQEKLEEWDIEMMLLPDGMNRRKINQSTYDTKYVAMLCDDNRD
jgi:hypothetical protein